MLAPCADSALRQKFRDVSTMSRNEINVYDLAISILTQRSVLRIHRDSFLGKDLNMKVNRELDWSYESLKSLFSIFP